MKKHMITISGDWLQDKVGQQDPFNALFASMDDGTVLTLLDSIGSDSTVPGKVQIVDDIESIDPSALDCNGELVRVFAGRHGLGRTDGNGSDSPKRKWPVKGYIFDNGLWIEADVIVVPVREQLFSRSAGLLESDALAGKGVLVIGLGSGGSMIVTALAQSGVTRFNLIDHDRLEVGNISRHVAGLSQVGRLKINVMKDMILDKNPYAVIDTCSERSAGIRWSH